MRANFRRGAVCLIAIGMAITTACTADSNGSTGEADPNAVMHVAWDINRFGDPIFDPVDNAGGTYAWMSLIYGTMAYETRDGLKPGLATKWEFPDALTMVLTIRKGITFQDGTPFNAEAVKTSWDRVIASKEMVKAAATAALESVEVDGDKVIVHFSEPVGGDWRDRYLTYADAIGVISPTQLEKVGEDGYASAPIGAGPYKLEKYVPGQSIKLARWDGYWAPELQKLAGLEFKQAGPGAPTTAAMTSGDANFARVNPSDVEALEGRGIEVTTGKPLSTIGPQIIFCATKGPFRSLDARKAVAMVIDRDAISKRAFNGLATPNTQLVQPNSPYYTKLETPHGLDVDKAKSLADSSGLAGSTVKILIDQNPTNSTIAQVLQGQLKKIGVTLEIETVELPFESAPSVNPDMSMQASGGSLAAFGAFAESAGVGNWCGNKFDDIDVAWPKTRDASVDTEGTRAAWTEVQNAVWANLPFVSLVSDIALYAHTKSVSGVNIDVRTAAGSLTGWTDMNMSK